MPQRKDARLPSLKLALWPEKPALDPTLMSHMKEDSLCKTSGKFNKAHTVESLSSCCYQAELCRKQLMFLQKSSSLALHQSLKNPKTTKSLFSAQSIDGSEAFDLKIFS